MDDERAMVLLGMIAGVLDAARFEKEYGGGLPGESTRSFAMVVTKLDEAEMWMERAQRAHAAEIHEARKQVWPDIVAAEDREKAQATPKEEAAACSVCGEPDHPDLRPGPDAVCIGCVDVEGDAEEWPCSECTRILAERLEESEDHFRPRHPHRYEVTIDKPESLSTILRLLADTCIEDPTMIGVA